MKEFDNGLDKKFEFDFSAPKNSQINIEKLKSFISQDKNPTIIFYGGEPLLQIPKIQEIIENIPKATYCIQTNGKLLNELPTKCMNNFKRILVSLDGDQERTDKNRGAGTYEKVISNLKLIREKGYKGEIVARMTIAQDCPDLFEQIQNLLQIKEINSIHWQLDVGFYKNDFNQEKLEKFFNQYNKQITLLVDYWIQEIKKQNIIKLYPFFGIANRLLGKDKETRIQCGASYAGYAITTTGIIAACPILNNIKDFQCGNLDSKPSELKQIQIQECNNCEVQKICGGRCLYWRKAKLWPTEGDDLICNSIKHLISKLRKHLDSLKNINLEYEKYFGPEIIP